MEGRSRSRFLEALDLLMPTQSQDEFVDDLLALVRALEEQGLSREKITARVMHEVNIRALEHSNTPIDDADAAHRVSLDSVRSK